MIGLAAISRKLSWNMSAESRPLDEQLNQVKGLMRLLAHIIWTGHRGFVQLEYEHR